MHRTVFARRSAMRRWKSLAAIPIVAAGLLVGPGQAGAAAPVRPAACSGTTIVQITSLTFAPPAVAPGGSSTATLKAQNCTQQALSTSVTWTAKFASSTGTGLPAGCPVIDPLSRPGNFPAGGTLTQSTGYLVPAACTATALKLTVRIVAAGTTLATGNASLLIIQN